MRPAGWGFVGPVRFHFVRFSRFRFVGLVLDNAFVGGGEQSGRGQQERSGGERSRQDEKSIHQRISYQDNSAGERPGFSMALLISLVFADIYG
jgi:hypothetical protein